MTAVVDLLMQLALPPWWPAVAVPGAGLLAAIARPRARAARSRLTLDRCVVPAVAVAVALLGAGALYTSLAKVSTLAGTWLPGVLVDGAIGVFTVITLAKAKRGLAAPRWMERLQWLLILCTVVANAWDESNVALQLLHGAQPILWKAAVAGLKSLIVDQAGAKTIERIPAMRWALAPIGTFRLWRAMVLGQIASYAAAVEIDNQRLEAEILADHLADRAVSPHQQVLYRTLTGRRLPTIIQPGERKEATRAEGSGEGGAPRTPGAARPAPARRRPIKPAGGPLTDQELSEIAVRLAAADPAVLGGWKPLARALRAEGHGIGTTRAQTVLDLARAMQKEHAGA